MPLLGWLNTYTFPVEARYKDGDVARVNYRNCVMQSLKNGTTTACYYATIHNSGSLVLVGCVFVPSSSRTAASCNIGGHTAHSGHPTKQNINQNKFKLFL